MPTGHPATAPRVAARAGDAAPFASLGLGEARRLATASAPGGGKPSRHAAAGGAGGAPPDLPARPRTTAERRAGLPVRVVAIREAGPDGSRVRRPPGADGTGSRAVDPAPTAADRRHRRAETGTTGRGKLAHAEARARDGRRVRPTVRPPGPGEEGRRRPTRGRGTPPEGRARHTDRIEGPPAGRGATDHGPPRKDRPTGLDAPGTGAGVPRRSGSRRRSGGRSSGSPRRRPRSSVGATRWPARRRAASRRRRPPPRPARGDRDRAPARRSGSGRRSAPATDAARRPRRPGAEPVAERRDRARAGHPEGRRPPAAPRQVELAWPRLRHQPDCARVSGSASASGKGAGGSAGPRPWRSPGSSRRPSAARDPGRRPRGAALKARAGRTSSRGPDRDRSAGSRASGNRG